MLEIARSIDRPMLEIEGTYPPIENVSRPEYGVPREVVGMTAAHLELLKPNVYGIDPMCGYGTINGAINDLGGNCWGKELDMATFNVARQNLPRKTIPVPPKHWLVSNQTRIKKDGTTLTWRLVSTEVGVGVTQGDCRESGLPYPDYIEWVDYEYISVWFDLVRQGRDLDPSFVTAFDRMLKPGGVIVIDSADEAVRHGELIRPADATVEYFEHNGYHWLDAARFRTTNAPPGCDSQFTELVFVRKTEFALFSGYRKFHDVFGRS